MLINITHYEERLESIYGHFTDLYIYECMYIMAFKSCHFVCLRLRWNSQRFSIIIIIRLKRNAKKEPSSSKNAAFFRKINASNWIPCVLISTMNE